MIWFDSYLDLQYYNPPTVGVDCYCELLVEPEDLLLQAKIDSNSSGSYEVKVEMMTPDGVTTLSDVTQYFKWYAFRGIDGEYYINLQANRFAPLMCTQSCFVLKLTVNRVLTFGNVGGGPVVQTRNLLFQKYTERYCMDSCCMIPNDIDIELGEIEGEYDALDYSTDDYFAS